MYKKKSLRFSYFLLLIITWRLPQLRANGQQKKPCY